MTEASKTNGLPEHIAIIMDGNGRWAKKRNFPRTKGHLEGIKRVEEIVSAASRMGIKILTLYAFSTENWNRPKTEISMLMKAFISALNRKIAELDKNNIRLTFIGREQGIPKGILRHMHAAKERTKNNTGMILNIAFNYGARCEIVDAIQKIASQIKKNTIEIDDINEKTVTDTLYTSGLSDPDLLIRTSGEKRISNFLLWQISYSELYFTDKCWPDFNTKELQNAVIDFKIRERRYGRTSASKR